MTKTNFEANQEFTRSIDRPIEFYLAFMAEVNFFLLGNSLALKTVDCYLLSS
jgi:hypothetical protein